MKQVKYTVTDNREIAPGVAVRIRTGLTADCTGLAIEEGSGLLLGVSSEVTASISSISL